MQWYCKLYITLCSRKFGYFCRVSCETCIIEDQLASCSLSCIAAPAIWISLPEDIILSSCGSNCRRCLKMFYNSCLYFVLLSPCLAVCSLALWYSVVAHCLCTFVYLCLHLILLAFAFYIYSMVWQYRYYGRILDALCYRNVYNLIH